MVTPRHYVWTRGWGGAIARHRARIELSRLNAHTYVMTTSSHPLDQIPVDIHGAYKLVGIEVLGFSVTAQQLVLAWGVGCRADPEFTEMKDGYDGKARIWRIDFPYTREALSKPIDEISEIHSRIAASGARR